MNRFLEEKGFISPIEKSFGILFLIAICLCGSLLFIELLAIAVFFPTFSIIVITVFTFIIVYPKIAGNICPLCDETIQKADRHEMDCGRYCHKWCAHMLERNETP